MALRLVMVLIKNIRLINYFYKLFLIFIFPFSLPPLIYKAL